jgi:hypothetical protein
MKEQTFSTFNELRKEAYEHLKEYREQFVKIVLNKHGIKYDDKMSKREIRELFEANIVGIVKHEDRNLDMIYKEGNLIGYWNRNIELRFNKKGRLICKIQYRIY